MSFYKERMAGIDPLMAGIVFEEEGGGGGDFGDDGFNSEGFNAEGFNSDGYNTEGYNAEGLDSSGKAKDVSWRDSITDDALKPIAERYNSPSDMAKGVLDMRQKLSTSIRIPGEGASADDLAAYNKALGVPDSPEGYEFTPHKDGYEFNDQDLAFQGVVRGIFHEAGAPKELANKLNAAVNELTAQIEENEIKADKKFVEDGDAALKTKWGADFDRNSNLAERAVKFGMADNFDDFTQLKMADGRFVLDHPMFKEMFAKFGAEMSEGNFEMMDEGSIDTVKEQIETLQKEIYAAHSAGDVVKANELSEKQRGLYGKLGNKPAVGHDQRTA